MKKKLKIPKPPKSKSDKKSYKRKVRRSWKRKPETQIENSAKIYDRKKDKNWHWWDEVED